MPVVPFTPRNFSVVDATLDLVQVENEFIAPERRPLADRHELRGLKMRVAEAGQVLPALGERRQRIDRADELVADKPQGHLG